ncbi:MAG TPA: response regulator transcription factor [Acidobacteriaceae bacterium]
MRVLVVEDEFRLAENIATALREGPGYAVDIANDGRDGSQLGESGNYDLLVLDLMLPGINGLQLLRRLRSKGQNVPVLVLTAVSGKESIIELLNAGADDYLGKPFDLGELLARAKALIRRGKGVGNPVIQIGRLTIDTLERTVMRDGDEIELSPTEYRILEYLSYRPRSIVSKEKLLEHLYDYNWERHSNVIEAHISNLRRKLNRGEDTQWIETLRGRGYRLLASPREGAE